MSDNLTTAAYLGQFRNELLDAGIPHYEADSLVRDAARQILRDQGVSVRKPEPKSAGPFAAKPNCPCHLCNCRNGT